MDAHEGGKGSCAQQSAAHSNSPLSPMQLQRMMMNQMMNSNDSRIRSISLPAHAAGGLQAGMQQLQQQAQSQPASPHLPLHPLLLPPSTRPLHSISMHAHSNEAFSTLEQRKEEAMESVQAKDPSAAAAAGESAANESHEKTLPFVVPAIAKLDAPLATESMQQQPTVQASVQPLSHSMQPAAPQSSRPLDASKEHASSSAHSLSSNTPWLDSAGLGQSLSPRLSQFNSPPGTESLRRLSTPQAAAAHPQLHPNSMGAFPHVGRFSPSMQHVPMQAKTIEFRGLSSSMPSSRRSSVSRAPGETEEEEHDESMSMASSRRGSLSLPFSLMPLPRGSSLSMHALPTGLSLLSPGSTAPASAASSVPTSPMRHFHFNFAPGSPAKVVTTLVPVTSLQQAGRKAEQLRKQQLEAKRAAGSPSESEDDEDMDDEEDDEEEDEEEAAAAVAAGGGVGSGGKKRALDGAAQTAAARHKKQKKKRRSLAVDTSKVGGAVGGGESIKKKKLSAGAILHHLASAVSHTARMRPAGRRKSVPPAFFGEESAAAAAGGGSSFGEMMDDGGDAAAGGCADPAFPRSPSPVKDKSCELCHRMHAGTYGGGRFCGSKCARHFSIAQRWEKKQGRE